MSHITSGADGNRRDAQHSGEGHLSPTGGSPAGTAPAGGIGPGEGRTLPHNASGNGRPQSGEVEAIQADRQRQDGVGHRPVNGAHFDRKLAEFLRVEGKLSGERRFATCTRRAKEVLDELLERLTHLRWDEDERFAVHLAVEEALMNAIKHGNAHDSSKHVHVVHELTEARIRIQITDEGEGFDPAEVPDPTLDENLDLPSGRGLMLMRSFMTRVEYNERGNQVTMEKHRGGNSAADPSE